jgi:hypothetical protein
MWATEVGSRGSLATSVNPYRVVRKLAYRDSATHRAVAAVLISALVGLALFSVTHIHGITDPDESHNAADLSLQAQMGTGLALITAGSVIPAPVLFGLSRSVRSLSNPLTLYLAPTTRGPPESPQ